MTAHQEHIRRACEKMPLFRRGMVIEGRYVLTQDAPAMGCCNARDTITGKLVMITVHADVLLWDLVQLTLEKVEAGATVVNLPGYAVKKQAPRTVRGAFNE